MLFLFSFTWFNQSHSACYFASLQAAGAHSDPFHSAVVVDLHRLKVWEPAALVENVRVTHLITCHRPFSTDFTASCHIVAPPCTLADIRVNRHSVAHRDAERGIRVTFDHGCFYTPSHTTTAQVFSARHTPVSQTLILLDGRGF